MIYAFVTVQPGSLQFSADGQTAVLSGALAFSDSPGQTTDAVFPVPLSALPAAGDMAGVTALATAAVQQITGRTVDRVLVSGWFW